MRLDDPCAKLGQLRARLGLLEVVIDETGANGVTLEVLLRPVGSPTTRRRRVPAAATASALDLVRRYQVGETPLLLLYEDQGQLSLEGPNRILTDLRLG